ncbi:uncharacterized protein BO97DRAFT_429729 [Aspergillus homomorphus CBS 101889]|uniref:Uncharacterized protein n=1 Tax=Aspergillus homomorphus (strain CBS 101889) TaxID=1450537 RepID=A0A395HHK3_ASPHC|nr:hypothetical protein BO97DRAFT_429729 [Aspergillus homomorphus CBS 101889]RAL06983.1 hypothetical protein BO97DRAFT_429729 [Aspergillus homomorphus CBS 101889]
MPSGGPAWIDTDLIHPFFYFPAVRKIKGVELGPLQMGLKPLGDDEDGDGLGDESDDESDNEDDNENGNDESDNESDNESYNVGNPTGALTVEEPLIAGHSYSRVNEIIAHSCFDNRGICNWLEECSPLKHVDIRLAVFRDDEATDSRYWFRACTFFEALEFSQKTRETLRLGADWQPNEERHMIDDGGPLGSFMDSLLSKSNLVDILPDSIPRLGITDLVDEYYADLLQELLDLVEQKDNFPLLEEIILYVDKVPSGSLDLLGHYVRGGRYHLDR